jgi:late competence protein required for DNA uptake (superfamily II DNA/RNA helicase)
LTFKDLKKRVSLEATTAQHQQSRLTERLHNKPFWIWDKQLHKQEDVKTGGDCCFNHIIGLPQKDGNDKPLYDYEEIVFNSLITQNGNKHLWIKKATGLGVSEFMLRSMAWLCLKDNKLSSSQMCIVTGPRIDLAIALIDRMKRLFAGSKGLTTTFDTKETVIELNNVKIEAFPSHHLDAMRGLPNVSFILLDEADFFPPGQQQDARDVSERYIAKSDPYIVMVSTPNAPDGLFETIEKEAEDTCLYKRIFLDYTYGIGKIYTAEEIEKAKQSPSFERDIISSIWER